MKFAEYLKDNLVPEWKDKYLDYKGGKKKIKKITSSPTFLGGKPTNPLSTPKTLAKFPSTNLRDFKFNQKTNDSFEELPPAAVNPTESIQTVPQKENTQPANDRTPLLYGTPADANYSQSSLNGQELQDQTLRKRTHTETLKPQTYSGGSVDLATGFPLESCNDTSEKEFTEWLDRELHKIESFYKQREDNAVQRFLLLQDQLYHLREENDSMKKKAKIGSDELIKTGIAKTTKRLYTINKFELPSLPFITNKSQKDIDDASKKKDFQQHIHTVPFYVARRQLKAAVQEYYRGLELLKSYRMLNRTGFRKLLKKFDKQTQFELSPRYMEKVNGSNFASSDVLDNIATKVEDVYSTNFENGNRKIAVEKLRSSQREDKFYGSMFFSGIFYGLSIPLLAYAIYLALHKTIDKTIIEGKFIITIWAGFFMIILLSILFGICCQVWASYKVNYRFIFEFNPRTALNWRQFHLIPSFSLFALSLFAWFGFNDFWPEHIPSRDWPWFFFAAGLIILLNPFNVLYMESRKWLLNSLWRLMFSGFYPVEFRDFFIGDMVSSLTYTTGNLSFFFCLYGTHWRGAEEGDPVCGSSRSRLMGFCSTLPAIWRLLQCFRRYADSGDWFPHLANMAKYGVSMTYYITLSVYRIDKTQSHRAIFIFFAVINSVYSSLWDIFMDWSLMHNRHLLRDDLIFPKTFYYFSMVADVLLRFQWIFYALFSENIQQSAVTSFCVAIAEIIRRAIWVIIRLENEHVTNIHLYRASRETPLPYGTVTRAMTPRESIDEAPEQHPRYHEESQPDIESTLPEADQERTNSLRRRKTILDTAIFQNVSKAIVNAHAKDFQRRKQNDNMDNDASNSSDDENSDDENTIIGRRH